MNAYEINYIDSTTGHTLDSLQEQLETQQQIHTDYVREKDAEVAALQNQVNEMSSTLVRLGELIVHAFNDELETLTINCGVISSNVKKEIPLKQIPEARQKV